MKKITAELGVAADRVFPPPFGAQIFLAVLQTTVPPHMPHCLITVQGSASTIVAMTIKKAMRQADTRLLRHLHKLLEKQSMGLMVFTVGQKKHNGTETKVRLYHPGPLSIQADQ